MAWRFWTGRCNVSRPDALAYCKCRLRTDVLAAPSVPGVYMEVDVRSNADNMSLAVMDFEGGGTSSVTFSPETGAVLRERKVKEAPRVIEGSYMHLLPQNMRSRRFEGSIMTPPRRRDPRSHCHIS